MVLMMCSYCCKQYSESELKPMKHDDNPKLKRVYCPRCLPEVEEAYWTLPWVKDKLWRDK